jgi:Uma2 family endonuclease
MSLPAEEVPGATFEQFLAAEQISERRHEFVGGRVYVMAGGSERHDLLAGLVYEALATGARASGCRPFIANRMIKTSAAAYYPDVMICCGPAGDRLFETDATLIVEVLSSSTEQTDRREKAAAYAGLPSLRLYLLVDQVQRRVEVADVVDGQLTWRAFGPESVIPTRYGDINVDVLYDGLDASATTP